MKYSIVLDIGATKTLGGLVINNKVIYKIKQPTQAKAGKQKVIKNILNIIDALVDLALKKNRRYKLEKIGIGLAGQVNHHQGVVLSTTNFSRDFKNIKLAMIIKDKYKVPVRIDNDVKCFLQGEMRYGIGRGMQNVVGLTLGTGIGGALLVDGKLWRGKDNTAGEVCHMKISGQWIGPVLPCGCGQKYCWESMASGRAWQKLKQKYGSKKANEVVVYNLVTGLLNLSYILNPEAFIIGGGLTEHKDLLPRVRREFSRRALCPWFKKVRIVGAKMKDEAILLGSLL